MFDTVSSRGQRTASNGVTPEPLSRMPSEMGAAYLPKADRRSLTGTGTGLRNFWPMMAVLGFAAVVLLSSASWVRSSASATAQPERLSQTIQQLSHNQAAMMEMLQKLAANSTAAATTAATTAAKTAGQQQEGADKEAKGQEDDTMPAAFAALPALTTLHNRLLRSSHSYERHRSIMKDVFERLVHLQPDAAAAEINKQLAQPSAQHMELFTYRLYKLLLSSGKLIPCRVDSTLVVNDPALAAGPGAGSTSSSSSHHMHLWGHGSSSHHSSNGSSAAGRPTRYFFATNLRDNSVNMPQYILSLLQTLLRLPQGSVFVSAYESNSDDGAHGWVDVLQLALNVIGTPSQLVTRGMLVRLEGSHRIEFLARVRNMALAPLYQHYAAAQDKAGTNSSSGSSGSSSSSSSSSQRGLFADGMEFEWEAGAAGSSASGSSSSSSNWRQRQLQATSQLEAMAATDDAANLPPGVLPWEPDFVVFVNDVYFCWGQLIRLLNYKADITCGMDFWQNADATVELRGNFANKAHKPKPHIPSEYHLERPIPNPRGPDQTNPIVFYDIWVARDLAGGKFWWTHPFVQDESTGRAAAKGLPFRASCCWNGMAVLKAAPFKAGVRVRPPMQGECQGSECTILCNDFARLGYDNVVVDAAVQLTYDWDLAREMMALGVEGVGMSTWAQAKAAGIADRDRKPHYQSLECCGLKSRFAQYVNFYTDCYREDMMARNWTHQSLHGS